MTDSWVLKFIFSNQRKDRNYSDNTLCILKPQFLIKEVWNLAWDFVPEIPYSTTSRTVQSDSLSSRRYGCSISQVVTQENAATMDEWRSLEWAGGGREHWWIIKSQIHFTARRHSSGSTHRSHQYAQKKHKQVKKMSCRIHSRYFRF